MQLKKQDLPADVKARLRQAGTEDHPEILFYFFVIPAAVTICALVMLWQLIFH